MGAIPFFARRFVAGTTLIEAATAVRELNVLKIKGSLDILGENVSSPVEADKATKDYCDLASAIISDKLDSHISIKLTMLGLDINEEMAFTNLCRLLEAAQGTFVRIDMEGSNYTSRTVDMFLRARAKYSNVGIVLQAYLYRTEADLDRVLGIGGRVRLCKGAYKEPSNIAHQDMAMIRQNYMKLAEKLVDKCEYPAFATHDDNLITSVLALTKIKARRPETFEFQMLYGLRRETWRSIVGDGYNMRVYVPYGEQWYPYFSRRLRERKENVFFIMKNLFKA